MNAPPDAPLASPAPAWLDERRRAVADRLWEEGHDTVELPMADGGEGFLDALGGANRTDTVTGPLGRPVEAGWRLSKRVAVIEMALASGLDLVGGADGNDPVAATTAPNGLRSSWESIARNWSRRRTPS